MILGFIVVSTRLTRKLKLETGNLASRRNEHTKVIEKKIIKFNAQDSKDGFTNFLVKPRGKVKS